VLKKDKLHKYAYNRVEKQGNRVNISCNDGNRW